MKISRYDISSCRDGDETIATHWSIFQFLFNRPSCYFYNPPNECRTSRLWTLVPIDFNLFILIGCQFCPPSPTCLPRINPSGILRGRQVRQRFRRDFYEVLLRSFKLRRDLTEAKYRPKVEYFAKVDFSEEGPKDQFYYFCEGE